MLLFAAAALVAVVVRDRGKPSEFERSLRKDNVFVTFRKEEIRTIEMQGPHGRVVLARTEDGHAQILEPVNEVADAHQVDTLLSAIEFATVVRAVGDTHPGLATPILTGGLTSIHGKRHFKLGDEAPGPPGSRYFQVEGEKVVVVPKSLSDSLLAKPDLYRERALASIRGAEIEKMTFGVPNGARVTLLAKGGGRFALESGFFASRAVVDPMLTAFADLVATSFLDEAGTVAAERSATTDVDVLVKGGAVTHLLVAGACPGRPDDVAVVRTVPKRAGFCVARQAVESLRTNPNGWADAWIERAPFSRRFDEIEEVRVHSVEPRATFEAVRSEGGWKVRVPFEDDLVPSLAELVSSHLMRLVAVQGAAPTHGVAPKSVVAEVELRAHEGVEKVQLFGAGADWKLFRESDAAVLSISEADRALFFPNEILRRLRPLAAPPQAP